MPSKAKHRISIEKLTFELREGVNRQLLIFRNDRKDTPHLTISWENPSKEIDVHLTRRSSQGEEHYSSVAKISESDFARQCEVFEPELRQAMAANAPAFRKVRPGWLWRNGFVVLYADGDTRDGLLSKMVPLKKRHSKSAYIIEEKTIASDEYFSRVSAHMHHPSALHEMSVKGYSGPVLAARARGGSRFLSLHLLRQPNGGSAWIAVDARAIARVFRQLQQLLLAHLKALLPPDAWATIFRDLRLDEIGLQLD